MLSFLLRTAVRHDVVARTGNVQLAWVVVASGFFAGVAGLLGIFLATFAASIVFLNLGYQEALVRFRDFVGDPIEPSQVLIVFGGGVAAFLAVALGAGATGALAWSRLVEQADTDDQQIEDERWHRPSTRGALAGALTGTLGHIFAVFVGTVELLPIVLVHKIGKGTVVWSSAGLSTPMFITKTLLFFAFFVLLGGVVSMVATGIVTGPVLGAAGYVLGRKRDDFDLAAPPEE